MIVERPALERRVMTSLEAGRVPVLLGGCGSGRTSLLLRLQDTLGPAQARYLDISAAATTPERCLRAVAGVTRASETVDQPTPPPTAREAFDRLLQLFDDVATRQGGATFLMDEFLDVRTFESFPGLRHVQRELIDRLARSPARFVLASRFTFRVHRLLRDAPARFEVIHIPDLDAEDTEALARRLDSTRRGWATDIASSVTALANGRPGPAMILLSWLAASGPATDPVAGLAALFSPDGQLTARCRESYELRLQRARGYGALKAILGILSEAEPLNLTEIAQYLQRTPGSTKDYLSWLEDVDLIASQGKRYSFEDPLLRLYVRLYARPVPPSDDDVVREIGQYARARLPEARASVPVPVSTAAPDSRSGIIEID